MTTLPPRRPRPEGALAEVLERDDELLEEFRGARFIRLLPALPLHFRRHGRELGERLESTDNPFDPDRAATRLAELHQGLDDLYAELAAVAPSYAEAVKPD